MRGYWVLVSNIVVILIMIFSFVSYAEEQGPNGLQGEIKTEKAVIAPGEDIIIEFTLYLADDTLKEPLHVWDNKYSAGYRADSYKVITPDGKEHLLRLKEQGAWDKNAPHPVEISLTKPFKLAGWLGTKKSLQKRGLDTTQKGIYKIIGVYEHPDKPELYNEYWENKKMWGGKLMTPEITVTVE